jgi:two-component system response regulator RegA
MIPLLMIDDDGDFCNALKEALALHGYAVTSASTRTEALQRATEHNFAYGVLDLNLTGESGLALITPLREILPAIRLVILTGYGTINTAIEAIKLGAVHYLTKPVTTAEIIAAFTKEQGDPAAPIYAPPQPLHEMQRDYLAQIFEQHGRNISATARALNMHRRTLQRKLEKWRIT